MAFHGYFKNPFVKYPCCERERKPKNKKYKKATHSKFYKSPIKKKNVRNPF